MLLTMGPVSLQTLAGLSNCERQKKPVCFWRTAPQLPLEGVFAPILPLMASCLQARVAFCIKAHPSGFQRFSAWVFGFSLRHRMSPSRCSNRASESTSYRQRRRNRF